MTGKVGIGKVTLDDRGLVMHTLPHAAELRAMEDVDEREAVPATVKPEEAKLARQSTESFEAPVDLATYTDE